MQFTIALSIVALLGGAFATPVPQVPGAGSYKDTSHCSPVTHPDGLPMIVYCPSEYLFQLETGAYGSQDFTKTVESYCKGERKSTDNCEMRYYNDAARFQ